MKWIQMCITPCLLQTLSKMLHIGGKSGKRFSDFKSELRHAAICLNSITQLMTIFTVDQAVDSFPDQSISCLV